MKTISKCLLGLGLSVAAALCQAQPFPHKLIRLVEPAGPGSAVDSTARDLVPGLAALLGQQVIIDNKPGANSSIGAREVARAAPDGYTVLHGNINNALNDLLTKDACCRLNEALLPVTRLISTPLVLVINPATPAQTLKEFLALAKSKPGQLSYASGGPGSITQLLGELVKTSTGVSINEVPYKAIGAELPDLLGGHVSAAYLAPSVVAQHIRNGRLRALGVAGPRHVTVIAEVPTFAEAGLPGVEASGWNGLFVPAGTPPAVIARLQADTAKALNAAEFRTKAADIGYEIGGESPEDFGRFVRAEIVKWGKVIVDSKIKLD